MRVIGSFGRFAAVRGVWLLTLVAALAAGPAAAQDITLTAASGSPSGRWYVADNSEALSGRVMRHPDGNAPKISSALANPSNYFELTFQAQAGRGYRLWLRGKAQNDYWGNDSVFVQFSGSVTSGGSPTWRIGSTSATEVNLEECSGCGLSGFTWQDNGWGRGALGPLVYFANTGTQRIRIQTREDGLAVDRIVLSSASYLTSPPGGSTGSSSGSGSGSASAPTTTDVVLSPAQAPTRVGRWTVTSDSGAFGGSKLRHPDAGAGKISTARSNPTDYFEMTFTAQAGQPYRLWLHGRAQDDHWGNDSVFVQFAGSVTSSGSATWRIGTTSATEVNLEDCSGCGLSSWKWQDNGWGRGVLGPLVYFATSGTQRIRVQTREDGLAIDRIILSPASYLTSAPTIAASGGGSTAPPPEPAPAPAPPPPPPPSGTLIKVLDWNIHHGVGTDGVYNIDRLAAFIASTGANVVSLNEVEKNNGWGNEDQPARFASLLGARTGVTWYYRFAQRDGLSSGQGNLLLSRFPLESSGSYLLSWSRSVARIAVIVNGIRVNVFSTHLDSDSSSRRSSQMSQLRNWAATYSEQRILAGDFNAWPGAAEISTMTSTYNDAWAVAVANNLDVAYAGNTAGNTRNSRIDYVWFSRGASRLRLTRMQVYDARSNGVQLSDHRPIMATFEVR